MLGGNAWTLLLVVLIWWGVLVAPGPDDGFEVRGPELLEFAGLMLASIGLAVRRRHVLLTLGLTAGADLASVVIGLEGGGYHVAGLLGVFFVSMRMRLSRAVAYVGPAMGLVYVAQVRDAGWHWVAFAPFWVIVTTALATSFGQVRYLRERLLTSLSDRLAAAEAAQEAVARSRVVEDRLQTARELHDVIGHGLAVVHLSAAAALRSLDDDPGAARRALEDIDEAARNALADIDQLLADLRAGDSTGPPEHDLGALDPLIARFRRYGLDIREYSEGDVRTLPDHVVALVKSVVAEALTNAYKHGSTGAPVHLGIIWHPDQLALTISNSTVEDAGDTSTREGWGLHGLRERLTAIGGSLDVCHEVEGGVRGVFAVDVLLPTMATPSPTAPADLTWAL